MGVRGWWDHHVDGPVNHAWGWVGGKAAGAGGWAAGKWGSVLQSPLGAFIPGNPVPMLRGGGWLAGKASPWLAGKSLTAAGGIKGVLSAAGGLGWKILAGAGAFLGGAFLAGRVLSAPRRSVTRVVRSRVRRGTRGVHTAVERTEVHAAGGRGRLLLLLVVLLLLGVVSPGQLLTPVAPGTVGDGVPDGGVVGASSSCATAGPVDVASTVGLPGAAARLGAWVHGLATWDGDPQDTYRLLHGAAVKAGEILGTFRSYLDGRHLTVTAPAVPSGAQAVSAASCCPTTAPPTAPTGTAPDWQPHTGDSPAQAAARALSAALAADMAAGLATPDPVEFLAIAGAESGYDPQAKNPTSTATGLWQLIDSNWHGIDPRDPYANARAAVALWRAQGPGAWVVWTSGAYRSHLVEARAALQDVSPGFTGPTASAVEVDAAAPLVLPAACATPTSGLPAPTGTAEAAVQRALSQRGVPYSWGGGGADGPSLGIAQGAGTVGYDCSGLVSYAYGLRPRQATPGLLAMGMRVTPGQERRGDLVFPDPGHVGIALGDGTYVEAPHTGDVVKVAPYGTPWAVVRLALTGARPA